MGEDQDTVIVNGVQYDVADDPVDDDPCEACAAYTDTAACRVLPCVSEDRWDGRDVIFIRAKPQG